MSIREHELIQKLQTEYDELFSTLKKCNQAIETLAKQSSEIADLAKQISELENDIYATIEKELHSIESIEKSKPQLERIDKDKKKLASMAEGCNQEANEKIRELREINEKLTLIEMNLNFQKDLLKLWNNEEYYRSLLGELGLSSRELLLNEQGYVIPDIENAAYMNRLAKEYSRIGRKDIAELFTGLLDQSKQFSIFAIVKECYAKSPDYNYGIVLAVCYEQGYGTPINKKAAFEVDQRFALENHPIALCSVAEAYFDGDLIEPDYQKAIEYYERATRADQKEFYSPYCRWGIRLLEGNIVKKDETKGLRLLKIADENGIEKATLFLAKYYFIKGELLENPENSESAENPENLQNTEIPENPNNDSDIKNNQELCYFYAKKAADTSISLGKYFLAICYAKGWGINQNIQQFITLLHTAANLNSVDACFLLASQYQNGIPGFLEPNSLHALKLYFKSLRINYSIEGCDSLASLLLQNSSNLMFMETAYDLCKKCLQGHLLDNPLDSTVVGQFYQRGILLPSSLERAVQCYQKGSDLGEEYCADALIFLAMNGESSGLLAPSTIGKYLPYASGDDDILKARQYYETNFTPLYQSLHKAWQEILGTNDKPCMPDGITRLIADYAYTPAKAAKTVSV